MGYVIGGAVAEGAVGGQWVKGEWVPFDFKAEKWWDKKERRKVKDGEVRIACEKACDNGAITFGDALDKNSRISKEKKNPRSYYLIEELNTQPSVFYKTKVRNKKV